MEKLFVLYDSRCGLCSWARRWLASQPAIIPLTFIPAGSPLAARLFPGLTPPDEDPDELVVVSDDGAVYREGSAWIMCLFALEDYREWSNRLAHPLLLPLARQGFALLSRRRASVSRWLRLASEAEIAGTLHQVGEAACVRAIQPVRNPKAGRDAS
ncbi:DCC1-like thiol-disulfide oxidoreductase family protein [Aquisphaera insulae]|uniref:DCC1-like thiol-disulfide oxidoreductase family protein n=1 Tax=Aquisphaera insulae TaxID=2712864 RepID=UPI0013EA9A89|nr:DCC1-like thiol-disulfide oxidoreductase family protein [Aquisphaera insulae]